MSKRSTTFLLAMALGLGNAAHAESKKPEAPWAGEELPLPLAVRTPEDLAVKAVAERAYLIFNLLAGGKVAWDAGQFGQAAQKWERLLSLSGLDAETERVVRPMAIEARRRAGGEAAAPVATPVISSPPVATATPVAVTNGIVKGTVQGGGTLGSGGTVVWLRRKDGTTPRPAPMRGREMTQKDKTFVPHVLPVTVGSKVAFHNEDTIFHNVFSLSRPNDFDGGLYKDGASYSKTFNQPGAVQVLCNIHAQMLGYVVVVDSPWFAQAGSNGRFTIRNVPAGAYELVAWHESSSEVTRQALQVEPGPASVVTITLGAERSRLKFVPDKYGKPRQVQLGY